MTVVIAGAAISPFGIFEDRRLRDIVAPTVSSALADAELQPDHVGLVVFGNAAAGLLSGQEMIRAHTSLATSVLAGRPTVAVENACASSSSAFHLATMAIDSGAYEFVVVVGAEKMSHADRGRARVALRAAMDVEPDHLEAHPAQNDPAAASVFMEIYAAEAQGYMAASGATAADFAAVAAKSSINASLNPIAQIRTPMTVDEVLAARMIVDPLTKPMCSPIGDGAAALVLCSEITAARRGIGGPRVLASVLRSGQVEVDEGVPSQAIRAAFEQAGISPNDIDVAEVHDAAAPAELIVGETLGLVPPGDGPKLIRDGIIALGGRCPLNPSGGLVGRGHPIGATGAAQIAELTIQLRGGAGSRQVGNAQIGLAENAGGALGTNPAACAVTILAAR